MQLGKYFCRALQTQEIKGWKSWSGMWQPYIGSTIALSDLPDFHSNCCIIAHRIARKILVEKDFKFDLNLNESLYLIYGVGPVQAPRALRSHALGLVDTPEVSKGRVNISSGSTRFGANDVRRVLTRLHGILMWISWPILGMTGIFFALWMRPIKPEGRWFQVHRALMVASLFVGALGVFFIFVAQYRRGPIRGLINFKDNVCDKG